MNKNIERGELTATFTFALALLVALLATWVSGCGDTYVEPASGVTVEVSCDEPVIGDPRCFYTAHGADFVEVYYNGFLAWGDRGITEARVVYIDGPGAVFVAVEACDSQGCAVDWQDLR